MADPKCIENLAELFALAPEVAGGCRVWLAARDRHGYGKLKQRGRTKGAHRVAYEMAKGPVPDGLVLDHLCRNRACVNPDHMQPVTNRENILRGKVRRAKEAAR